MFKNFLVTVIRNHRRHYGYVLINMFGLAVSITVFTLIMSYVQYEYGADKAHHNYDNIYRVDLNDKYGVTPITLRQEIADRFPDIVCTRYFPRWATVIYEKKKLESKILFADAEFFELFDYEAVQGDFISVMNEPASAIVTESWAKKMFGEEPAIGKTINYNREIDLEIKAIMKDPEFRSQLLVREVIAPLHSLKGIIDFEDRWFSNFVTFLQFPAVVSQLEMKEQIENFFLEQHNEVGEYYPVFFLRKFSELYFDSSKFDYCYHGNHGTVMIFLLAAIFIILIACCNYINLSTARAGLRAREMGIRKVNGSSRELLICQMLVESVLLCIISLIVSLAIVWLIYPVFSDFFKINSSFFTVQRLLLLLGFTIGLGLAAGLYPAFYQTSYQPVDVIKGELRSGKRGVIFRKILIIIQFTISIAMISCTLMVFEQLDYFLAQDLGFDKEQVVTFRQTTEIMDNRDAFRQELLKSAHIEQASYLYLALGRIIISSWFMEDGDSEENKRHFKIIKTDPEFLGVYGIELKSGRNFKADIESDHEKILVNETFVKEFITGDPLQFMIWNDTEVIGVVEDFAFRPLQHEIEPVALLFNPDETFAVSLRIDPVNAKEAMDYVERVFHKYSPEVDFEYEFQDEVFAEFYDQELRFGKIFGYFAVLAVVIACLGMFGLASFLTMSRTKEIGVRKVLGAGTGSIILLLTREYTKMVLLAGMLAVPIAWLVMTNWLNNFAYRIELSGLNFVIAALGALVIAWLTVSWQTWKAARKNPVESLKYE
ncbi:MAG: ABC transporter permease [Candidatus Cloacimonetes bacterium]|nr:ABC transporter permease [Candidatus Cloacimonadota bacterium]